MAAHLRRSWQPKGRAEARSRRRDLRNVCFRRLCYCSPVRDHGGVPWTYNQRARSRVSGAPNRTQGACMFRGGRVSLRFLAGGAKACCRCKRRCWRADRTDPCERKLYPRAESSGSASINAASIARKRNSCLSARRTRHPLVSRPPRHRPRILLYEKSYAVRRRIRRLFTAPFCHRCCA